MEEKRKLRIEIVVQTNHERSFRIAPDYQKAIISTFFFEVTSPNDEIPLDNFSSQKHFFKFFSNTSI